jgi:hypothetical protein
MVKSDKKDDGPVWSISRSNKDLVVGPGEILKTVEMIMFSWRFIPGVLLLSAPQ